MEEMLSKFQNDLGSISSEIQILQDQSHSMSIKLKNRQVCGVRVGKGRGRGRAVIQTDILCEGRLGGAVIHCTDVSSQWV